jgi:LacI family transcriptional regulator
LRNLRGWDGDGILAFVETPGDFALVRQFPCPVLNLSSRLRFPELLTVGSDHFEIGRSAALHLREKGFERFAFYGLRGVWYSQERLRGFEAGLGGGTCGGMGGGMGGGMVRGVEREVLLSRSVLNARYSWDADRETLEQWLLQMRGKGPVGIFAVHDYRAVLLLEAARRLGIAVPGEFAVLGVNDDPVACGGSVPALSSVAQDGFAVGALAARLLERWIVRGKRPRQPAGIAPLPVVERASTDMFGGREPRMRRAMEFIEEALGRSFGVEEVAQAVGVSRRWLEQRFGEQLGMSPRAYLVKQRLRRVSVLRRQQPHLRLVELARQAGFGDVRALRAALRDGLAGG